MNIKCWKNSSNFSSLSQFLLPLAIQVAKNYISNEESQSNIQLALFI